jgi:hypothetical protein
MVTSNFLKMAPFYDNFLIKIWFNLFMIACTLVSPPVIRFSSALLLLVLVGLGSSPLRGQITNEITDVSPDSAGAGTSNLTVTFTLDTDAPSAPPAGIMPDSVSLGTLSGTSVTHPSQYVVTAIFNIPSDQPAGTLDAEVVFTTPQEDTLTFSLADALSVTEEPDPDPTPTPGAYTYPIVDTGQNEHYNNSTTITAPNPGDPFSGQDTQYEGNQPSYTVSGDGLTVYDNVTELTWTRSPNIDGDGDIDADDKMTQSAAAAYVATLNAASFGGFDDWRLPSIKELYSLMDFRGGDPSGYEGTDTSGLTPFIDTTAFEFGYGDTNADPAERIIDAQFATTTLYVDTVMGGQTAMFGLNLADGRIKGYPTQNKTFYVYYVRGNTDYGVNNLTDNEDGTVTDNATGLMWQQADSGSGMIWEDALAYAESLDLGGYKDWRLPNAKELQSILNYTRSPATTSSAAIDPVFSCTEITNEANSADYPFYWTGTTHAGWTGSGTGAVYVSFGRAMGYWNSSWQDVHGAGAQRSDPKTGDPGDYPTGHGPQGDAIRIYNYVRCVRGGGTTGPSTDSDGDGLTDWYEHNYTGSTTSMIASADDDGDGATNEEEEDAGTSASDAGSYFDITGFTASGRIPST